MRRLRKESPSTVLLAGWLIADLLLGLAMVFFVFNTVGPSTPHITISPSPTVIATFTPQPTLFPTRTPLPIAIACPPIGLDLTPLKFTISADPGKILNRDVATLNLLESQIKRNLYNYSERRVGLVITLGYHAGVADGFAIAKIANELLLDVYPETFRDALKKPFWWSVSPDKPAGTIIYEIYFLTSIANPE